MRLTRFSTCLFIAMLAGSGNSLFAQNWTGSGDGLDWHDAANWDEGTIPLADGDFAGIFGTTANPFNVEINQSLTVGDIDTSDTTLTINAATSARLFGSSTSILNVNADFNGSINAFDSSVNLNGSTLTGSLSLSGSNAQLNRTGGALLLDSLSLGNVSLNLAASDSSASTVISSGAVLTIDGASLTGSTSVSSGGVINFNSGVLNGNLDLTSGGVLNRDPSATLDVENLFLSDSTLELNSGDSVTSSTFIDSGATLTVDGGSLEGTTEFSGSTAILNSGSISGDSFLTGSTLDWNGGTIAGSLSLDESSLNRNTSEALTLSSLNLTENSSLTLVDGDEISNSTSIRSSSELTVDGASLTGSTSVSSGATLTVNSGSVGDVSIDDATFNFNSGALNGNLDLTSGAVLNRDPSTTLDVENLFLSDSTLELSSGDSVTSSTFIDSGATLTVDGGSLEGTTEFSGSTAILNSGSISGDSFLTGSTLDWNGGTIAGSLSLDESSLNRNTSEALTLSTLNLTENSSLGLVDGDEISGSTNVTGNSTLTIEGAIVDSINVSNGGTVNTNRVQANSTLSINDAGTVNVTDGVFSGGLSLNNGTLNITQGIIAGNVEVFGQDSIINRTRDASFGADDAFVSDASFDLTQQDEVRGTLFIDTNGSVNAIVDFRESVGVGNEFRTPISIGSLFIEDGSELNIFQTAGETTGVLLDDDFFSPSNIEGTINLFFDSELVFDEFDFALAVTGDRSSELQALIDSGQITITGNPQETEVFFDAANNRTSIGYFAAVPEPSSLLILTAMAAGFVARRRRHA